MRRQDIQLLASARQGDLAARCEIGRRYLLGTDGFSRHPAQGLQYLSHPSLAGSKMASAIIAESLPLHDIVGLGQLSVLTAAAKAGNADAQIKLGLWTFLTNIDPAACTRWWEMAAAQRPAARYALAALADMGSARVAGVLHCFAEEPWICGAALMPQVLAEALRAADGTLLSLAMNFALECQPGTSAELADATCAALKVAQALPRFGMCCPSGRIEALLESCVQRGSSDAALLLGRALCGFDSGALSASSLTTGRNLRRGAALLLRAADAGAQEAWELLYCVHADNHTSVANPQMARFFLEKAAVAGNVSAQRRLGALILRAGATLYESERGIHWLYEAARQGDAHSIGLLCSLMLPVVGLDEEANDAIDTVRRHDPWMACRLRTARDFALTKLEALSVDIVSGLRAWGLVVGANPFIHQAKLAAPRAIPALTPEAAQNLRRSVAFLQQARRDGAPLEGDLRKRSVRLRHLLRRYGLDESLFFAQASSTELHTLRQGTKWAFRARQPLRMALAA